MNALLGIILAASLAGWIATRRSLWCLPVVVSVSLLAQDSFYPLSHFPMYSDPNDREDYLYVATFEDDPAIHEPIPILRYTGLSAPRVKKMWRTYSRSYAAERGKKDYELTVEERDEVGGQLIEEFRKLAQHRDRELPERIALVEYWIRGTEEGGWTETESIIAARPSSGPPLSSAAAADPVPHP